MSSSIIVGGCSAASFLLMDLSGSPASWLSPLNETWWNGDKDDDRRRTLDAAL